MKSELPEVTCKGCEARDRIIQSLAIELDRHQKKEQPTRSAYAECGAAPDSTWLPDRIAEALTQAKKARYLRTPMTDGSNNATRNMRVKKHVLPPIMTLELEAQFTAEGAIDTRDEVTLPPTEKSRLVDKPLWEKDHAAETIADCMGFAREFQRRQAEQGRLIGGSRQDQRIESDLEMVVRGFQAWEKRYPNAKPEVKTRWIKVLSEGSNINMSDIVNQIERQRV